MNKILSLTLVFTILVSCSEQDKIEVFWKELEKNETEIALLPTQKKLDRLNSMIKKVSESLLIEISVNKNKNLLTDIVVSANGNKELFPQVDKIIDSAYKSKKFTFTALRQANPKYEGFNYDSMELSVGAMSFIPIETEQGLGAKFIVFEKALNVDKNFMEVYGPMTIDYLIGERTFAEEIIAYDFYFKSDLDGEEKALPLSELTNYLNKRREFYRNQKNN